MTEETSDETMIAAAETTASDQDTPAQKRRKLRKGTRSCWECKRRKIKCTFASVEHVTCIGCKRRRTPCISQDMPEDSSSTLKGNRYLSERLAVVEDVLKELLEARHSDTGNEAEVALQQEKPPPVPVNPQRANEHGVLSPPLIRTLPTPAAVWMRILKLHGALLLTAT